ncbi:MAG: hypothetical protein OQJ81_10950 [Melioribacteraceae bacterium]|nr:hypothetical protein [Melioribacteraceae bacterium]
MKICEKVQDIIKTKNAADFLSLVKFLKYQNCKTEAEIRGIFANCGMNPELFDALNQQTQVSKPNLL